MASVRALSFVLCCVLLLSFCVSNKDAAPSPNILVKGNCLFIDRSEFQLSIIDLEYDQKCTLPVNLKEIQGKTVEQFISELEEGEYYFSSHSASTRLLLPLRPNISTFSINPPKTSICNVIEVVHNANGVHQFVMYIGSELQSELLKQEQRLLGKFFKGLHIIDEKTGIFKASIRAPLTFKKSSLLKQKPMTTSLLMESHIVETESTSEATNTNGESAFVEVSSMIFSAEGKYSQSKTTNSVSGNKKRNAVVSLLSEQIEIMVEKEDIVIQPTFYKKFHNIFDSKSTKEHVKAKKIVQLLNEFGWYVSNHFVLGGRLDIQKSVSESSCSNATNEIKDLSTKVSAKILAFLSSVEVDMQHSSNSSNKNYIFSEDERITSTVNGAFDIGSFVNNMQNEENWRVIKLKEVVPTCKYLLIEYPHLFAVFREIMISNANHPQIKALQPNFDVLKYVNDLWDEYLIPF